METLCRQGRAAEDQAWMQKLCRGWQTGVRDVSTMFVLPSASNSLPSQIRSALPAALPEAASNSLPYAQQQSSSAREKDPTTGHLATPQDDTIVWDYLFRDHTFALSQPRTVSQIVDHCFLHIHRRLISMGIVVFKIGVAAEPGHRFNNPEFGYKHEGYMFMDVLWRGAPRDCAFLEDTLIKLFKTQSGCRNVNPGGGGINANNNSYQSHLYVVFAPCGDGIGIMAAKRKRQQSC